MWTKAGTALVRMPCAGEAGLFMRFCRGFSAVADPSPAEQIVAKLRPGDVLVQNEADSEIGKAVILKAKDRGLTTLNIIADKPGSSSIIEELKELGADIVVTESYTETWYIKRLMSDLPQPKLGLNVSDGSQATAVAKLLAEGATFITHGKQLPQHVSYPGAERRPVQWNRLLEARKLKAETLLEMQQVLKSSTGYFNYISEALRKMLPASNAGT